MRNRKLILSVSIITISFILIGIGVLYASLKDTLTPSEFQTLDDTAAENTKAPTATPSAGVKTTVVRKKATATPVKMKTVVQPTLSKNSTSNPTSIPTPKQTTQASATNTPQPQQETATPIPQPTATPTPQPQLSVSLSTSIDGNMVKVTAEANEPLKICIVYFLGENDIPKETKNASPDGNKCSSDNQTSDIKKIRIYLASNTGLTTSAEKSSPF